jgi:ribosomal protein S7
MSRNKTTETSAEEKALRELLRAEQNEWAGSISRQDLHRIAERLRGNLRGGK